MAEDAEKETLVGTLDGGNLASADVTATSSIYQTYDDATTARGDLQDLVLGAAPGHARVPRTAALRTFSYFARRTFWWLRVRSVDSPLLSLSSLPLSSGSGPFCCRLSLADSGESNHSV